MNTVAVIGSVNVDLVTRVSRMPVWGETLPAHSFALHFGGKGANQAVALAQLGVPTMMVARTGDDTMGREVAEHLIAQGLDCRFVTTAPGVASGVASIFVDDQGRNSILIVKGANGLLSPEDVDRAEAELATCRMLVLQLEAPLETVYRAIDVGRRHGVPVLLNPAPATELDFDRIRSVEFFVPNETELAAASGLSVQTVDDCRVAAQSLVERGLTNVIVTLGERGSLWVRPDGCDLVAPAAVKAIDTTGAGDAFIGAFVRFYLEQHDVRTAMVMANRYAALSTTKEGAQASYLTAGEFSHFCETSFSYSDH